MILSNAKYLLRFIMKVTIGIFRIPVPDLFDQKNCKTNISEDAQKIERNDIDSKISTNVEMVEDVNKTNRNPREAEDDYSSYDYDSYDYENDGPQECKDIGFYNNSVFEENEKLLYKELDRDVYCEYVEELETTCFEQSLLEIWRYNAEVISQLTSENILRAVNILDRSPYLGFKYDYAKLLGSVKRNSTGHIVSAKAALYNFNTVVDPSKVQQRKLGADSGAKRFFDENNIKWQDDVIRTVLDYSNNSTNSGTNTSP